MSMTQLQAKRLGALISRARINKGLSTRDLAAEIGVHHSWIGYLEQGKYLDPAAERLAAIAELLGIPTDRIERINRGAWTTGLPQPRSYFRAKYGLTSAEALQVERYIESLRGEG